MMRKLIILAMGVFILCGQINSSAVLMPGGPTSPVQDVNGKFKLNPPAIERFNPPRTVDVRTFLDRINQAPKPLDLTKLLPENKLDIFGHEIKDILELDLVKIKVDQDSIKGIARDLNFEIAVKYRDTMRNEIESYFVDLYYNEGTEITFLRIGDIQGLADILGENISIKDLQKVSLAVTLDEEDNIKLILEEGFDKDGKSVYKKEADYNNGEVKKESVNFNPANTNIVVQGEKVTTLTITYGGKDEEGNDAERIVSIQGTDSRGNKKTIVQVAAYGKGKSRTVVSGRQTSGISTLATTERQVNTGVGKTITGFDSAGNPLDTYSSAGGQLMASILSLSLNADGEDENSKAESEETVITTNFGEDGKINEENTITTGRNAQGKETRVRIIRTVFGKKMVKVITLSKKREKGSSNHTVIIDKVEEEINKLKGVTKETGSRDNDVIYQVQHFVSPTVTSVKGIGKIQGVSTITIFKSDQTGAEGKQQIERTVIQGENGEILMQIVKPIQEETLVSPLKEVRYVVTYQGKEFWFNSNGEVVNVATSQ